MDRPRNVWDILDKINLRDVISTSLVMSFMTALYMLFWRPIPSANEQLIVYMLGQLSGFVGGAISSFIVNNRQAESDARLNIETQGKLADAVTAAAQSTPGPSTTPVNSDVLREGDVVTLDRKDKDTDTE